MTNPTPNLPRPNRDTLQDLIDMGADIARMIHRQAQAQSATPTGLTPETTAAFDRIARTVRRTILLAQHLDHPPSPRIERDPAQDRAAARRHVIRAVEDTIQRETRGDRRAETIHAEFLDRLDSPEFEDDLQGRPIADLITEICRDLGLKPVPPATPLGCAAPRTTSPLSTPAPPPRALPRAAPPTGPRPSTSSTPPSGAANSQPGA